MLERVSSRSEFDRSHTSTCPLLCQRQLYKGMTNELLWLSLTHCIHIINTHIVSSRFERWFHCVLIIIYIINTHIISFLLVLRDDFLQSPSNTSVSIGDKAKFSCRPPRGEPTPKVLWMKGRKFLTQSDRIQISDNGDLIISQVTLNDADNYKCVATNTAGERESAPARLTVLGTFFFPPCLNSIFK